MKCRVKKFCFNYPLNEGCIFLAHFIEAKCFIYITYAFLIVFLKYLFWNSNDQQIYDDLVLIIQISNITYLLQLLLAGILTRGTEKVKIQWLVLWCYVGFTVILYSAIVLVLCSTNRWTKILTEVQQEGYFPTALHILSICCFIDIVLYTYALIVVKSFGEEQNTPLNYILNAVRSTIAP